MTTPDAAVRGKNRLNDSEAQVLERIEAFRRRRPRLIDDTVTLAHGAGGKASAALVDAVFVEAFGNATTRSAEALSQLSSASARIVQRGLKPIHAKATSNARRLKG